MDDILKKGIATPLSLKCDCGGQAYYREWLEPESFGGMKRCGVGYCEQCGNSTKIHSERTPRETKQEVEFEWKKQRKDWRNYVNYKRAMEK